MHDRGHHFIDPVPRRLRRLPCARWRKIIRLHRLDSRDLFSDVSFARSSRVRHVAASDPDAYSGVSTPLGPASTHWPLDDANLALCFGDGRARLFDALQMVPTTESCTRALVDV